LTLVLFSAGCKTTVSCSEANGDDGLSQADLDGIAANSATWLAGMRAADWKKVASNYTEDGMILPPDQPLVSGRENIRKGLAPLPPITSMDVENVEVSGCCDTAFVRGTYKIVFSPPGVDPIHETGKFIEIRRRQKHGTWLMQRDMFSSDAPSPAPAPH